jgi:hypothetical protein
VHDKLYKEAYRNAKSKAEELMRQAQFDGKFELGLGLGKELGVLYALDEIARNRRQRGAQNNSSRESEHRDPMTDTRKIQHASASDTFCGGSLYSAPQLYGTDCSTVGITTISSTDVTTEKAPMNHTKSVKLGSAQERPDLLGCLPRGLDGKTLRSLMSETLMRPDGVIAVSVDEELRAVCTESSLSGGDAA